MKRRAKHYDAVERLKRAAFRKLASILLPATTLPAGVVLLGWLLAACSGGDGNSAPAADSGTADTGNVDGGIADGGAVEFDEETELADPRVENSGECSIAYYWPVMQSTTPLFVLRYEPPAPPYEIRALSARVFSEINGGFRSHDCNGSVPVRLFAYVSTDADPMASGGAVGSWPDLTAIAEVEVSGTGGDASEIEVLEGVLEEPVLVEDEGYLFVGYEWVEEGTIDIACVAGCGGTVANPTIGYSYLLEDNDWNSEPGWGEKVEETPDLRVVIGH